MNLKSSGSNDVYHYIITFPKEVQDLLNKIRNTILKAAPKATERISYGMPYYEYKVDGSHGRLIYFAAFKKHISLFITPGDTNLIPEAMKAFHVSKATYQFPLNQPFPFKVLEESVKTIVRSRENMPVKSTDKSHKEDDISIYISQLPESDRPIGLKLRETIDKQLKGSESKIWHKHPVWFIQGNPIVGFSKQKAGIRLMFWSGASFEEEALNVLGGKFKDASIFYNHVEEINLKDLKRWLKKSESIQWDYKNLVKRKGKLERL